jgi:hypothetical protein
MTIGTAFVVDTQGDSYKIAWRIGKKSYFVDKYAHFASGGSVRAAEMFRLTKLTYVSCVYFLAILNLIYQ